MENFGNAGQLHMTPSAHANYGVASGGGGGYANESAGPNHFATAENAFGRSPPKGTPSSYGRFMQKRGRVGFGPTVGGRPGSVEGKGGGSLSGRLRSVSDMERTGIVTSAEKGRLKDLIIAGDMALSSALEK